VVSTYVRDVFFEQFNMGYGAFLGITIVVLLILLFSVYGSYNLLRGRRG
jgi:ABC-type sugar transport system permease subunit